MKYKVVHRRALGEARLVPDSGRRLGQNRNAEMAELRRAEVALSRVRASQASLGQAIGPAKANEAVRQAVESVERARAALRSV